jgi:hypothetical protein
MANGLKTPADFAIYQAAPSLYRFGPRRCAGLKPWAQTA